ncbi:MAG: hemerythrin domain-containing protein [Anaeromyxobacter sp.]
MVEFLGNYAHEHFADEERMMQFSAFPGLGEHLEQHQGFLEQWRALSDRLAAGGPTLELARSLITLLLGWVGEHVTGSDQELGRWLAQWRGGVLPPSA